MLEGRYDDSAHERIRRIDTSFRYAGETFKTWPVYVDSVHVNGERAINVILGINGQPYLIDFELCSPLGFSLSSQFDKMLISIRELSRPEYGYK